MVKCRNVVMKSEEGKSILKGVTFTINKGSIAVLLGLSGSGKTTLLNCIGGNIHPHYGVVQTSRNCRLVTSIPPFCDNFTGKEFVEMLLSISKKVDEQKVYELIERLGVSVLLEKKIVDACVYTKKLLILLSALCHDSETILLDEPFQGIDRQSQLKVKELILQLKEQGKTVIVGTHIISTGYELADEFILLHRGKTKQIRNVFQCNKQYEEKILPLLMR